MAFIIDAFPVADQQDLGGFVVDAGNPRPFYWTRAGNLSGRGSKSRWLPGFSALSSLFLTTALVEQRVLCLKITWGRPADFSRMSSSWDSVCKGIQFMMSRKFLVL
jgi:hypothetical protein